MEYPGAWYHVMNRGRRGEKIFHIDDDREEFIKVLRETIELWNLQVSAYCLMSNHYHLLVRTPDGNLSRCMRHLNGVYTQRFNRRHSKEGQLFRGRYKAVLVDDDSHLLEVLRYIHRNPLRSGIVKAPDNYPWSSHKGYLSWANKWSWLQKKELLAMLATVKSRQIPAYLDFVSKGEPEEIEKFYSRKNLPSILGNASFKEYIREMFSDFINKPEIPGAKVLAPDAEKVIAAVCKHYRISKDRLLASKRGTANLPRDVAIYLVRHQCRMTLPSVGRVFGIANYSSVSSVVQRVKTRLAIDGRLQKQLDSLIKSQKRT